MKELKGIIAPATTPFNNNGDLDVKTSREQFLWLKQRGCHGIAVGGSTGEGHTLSREEFCSLLETAVETLGNDYPLIAGIIVNSTVEAIERGRMARDLGADALQVTPVHYLFRPDDEAMVRHFSEICETTEMPLIIYNVVPWTYLSPELLCRIMREVPGVIGVKQSAGDLKLMADLLTQCQPDNLIFSAVDALLYPSFILKAKGAIAAVLAALPELCVELWSCVEAGNHSRALELHGHLLEFWNACSLENLPACVKFAQSLQGIPESFPRAPMPVVNAKTQERIKS
ncbi:uncharacterized protein METZ01_LOCUS386345, partial [marine metagenome]